MILDVVAWLLLCVAVVVPRAAAELPTSYASDDGRFIIFPRVLSPSSGGSSIESADMLNITVATHMTRDRVPQLRQWCTTWNGPISLALYIPAFWLMEEDIVSGQGAASSLQNLIIDEERKLLRRHVESLLDGTESLTTEDISCIRRHVSWHVVVSSATLRRGQETTSSSSSFTVGKLKQASAAEASSLAITYPFNVMRNAAADGVAGEWMLVVDIDLQIRPSDRESSAVPDVGSLSGETAVRRIFHKLRCDTRLGHVFYGPTENEEVILQSQQSRLPPEEEMLQGRRSCDDEEMKSKFVAVIPAAETVNKRVPMPSALGEIVDGLRMHSLTAFYGHYCRACHLPSNLENHVFVTMTALNLLAHRNNDESSSGAGDDNARCDGEIAAGGKCSPSSDGAKSLTNFDEWIEAVLRDPSLWPYRALFLPKYEPYVIMSKRARYPRFDERFVGRGYDKMSFFYEMFAQERNFVVLSPGPVLVHHGRGDEPIRNVSSEYMKKQRENTQVWEAFILRMKRKYARQQSSGRSADDIIHGSSDGGGSNETSEEGDHHVFVWPGSLASCPMDGLPCCVSMYRPPDGAGDAAGGQEQLAPEILQKMQDALSWCCTQIDCYPLHTYRRHPDHIAYHMDWAFTRYLRKMLQSHAAPSDEFLLHNRTFLTEHCSFDGMGKVWFPTQMALQMYTNRHVQRQEGGTIPREPSVARGGAGPQLECFVPVTESDTALSSSSRSVNLTWKALEWLCREELVGNCEGAVRELLLTHAPAREANETDLLFRARLLFTLYFQVSWHFEDEDAPSSCSFEGVARLRDPSNPQARLLSAKQYKSAMAFQWPMSLASCPYDGLPCCRARHRQEPVDEATLCLQEQALSWACEQIDCLPLHTYRRYPANLSFHMDWAFTRYLRKALALNNMTQATAIEDPTVFERVAAEACSFGELGELWKPSSLIVNGIQQIIAAQEEETKGEGSSNKQDEEVAQIYVGPKLECSSNPAADGGGASSAAAAAQKLCDEGSLGNCDLFVKEMQRTGIASIKRKEEDGESEEALRTRLLLTLDLQLHWQDAERVEQFCAGGVASLQVSSRGDD